MKRNIKRRKSNNGATDVENIPLAKIGTEKTQSRARINNRIVKEYAELMDDGIEFPPVVVFSDGTEYWLADGFHRYFAAQKRELESIDCDVRQGAMRDALEYSFQANDTHGLRRTNQDKRKAVEIALNDEVWSKLSDRDIAKLCGVSNTLVSNMNAKPKVSTVDTAKATPAETSIEQAGEQPAVANSETSGTSSNPLKIESTNGTRPINGGAPVVSEKDRRLALDLLGEFCKAMELLGLYDECSHSLEQIRVSIEALEF